MDRFNISRTLVRYVGCVYHTLISPLSQWSVGAWSQELETAGRQDVKNSYLLKLIKTAERNRENGQKSQQRLNPKLDLNTDRTKDGTENR